MRFALRPGLQLGKFYIGQTLHSALKQLKAASNGLGSPLWQRVDVLSPKDPLGPVIVVGQLEDGSKWTITFDRLHHIALTASITVDAPVGSSSGRILDVQEDEGSFPRHYASSRLLQAWVTTRDRKESLASICSTNGLTVLEACTVEQVNTSGTSFVSKVLCEGVMLTLSHDTGPSSNMVVPPPFIPASLQDLLPMDCHIVGIELVPQSTSLLLPLLSNRRTGNKRAITLTRPLQTIPYVHVVLGGSDGKVVGICVSQQCSPEVPYSTHAFHTPHYHGQRKVLFGDTMQSVLTELGAPDSCYYRTFDNPKVFCPLPERMTQLDQHKSCHRTDVFFNYFNLGMDVVFDAVSMGVKKFVLHASPPEAVEFETYSRCHFRLACSHGQLAMSNEAQIVFSPSHTWSQVASHLGTASRLQKVVQHRELEFLGHPCTTHLWYSALGQCMVEVLPNDAISCICILPDVVDECTLPPVPSEAVSLSVQWPAGQGLEDEASPSIPSSLPSTGDEFEDARSSFQTPPSSIGLAPSHKIDCPQPLLRNVNIVLSEAQRRTSQPIRSNWEEEKEPPENEDEIVVVPCFSDGEESEESAAEKEASNSDEEGREVDRECNCAEIPSDAAHGSSSPDENVEASLKSEFDVISSLENGTKVTTEEASSPNSSPVRDSDSIKEEQLATEPKPVLYKPGGSAGKASRLQDIIDSSRSLSGSKSEAKGGKAIVAGKGGNSAVEVMKKSSGNRSKFELSEREGRLLQRLCKPTATSLNRQAKASPNVTQTSEDEQQQYELEKMRPDQLMSTSNLMDMTEEVTCDATRDEAAPEADLASVIQTREECGHINTILEDDTELDIPPSDVPDIPLLQPYTQVNQFRSSTFDRLFPTEQPEEDTKPFPKAASTTGREAEDDEPLSSLGYPEFSLGSFHDALLKQFDIIKDCGSCGGELSAVGNGGHSDLCAANGSYGDQCTANGGTHGNPLPTNGSGATVQLEEAASAGVTSMGGSQPEETTTGPLLPLSDSPARTRGSSSSVIGDDVTVTSPGHHMPDDMGDSTRKSDTHTNSPSHEDKVALDTLQESRWMNRSMSAVPGGLCLGGVEPLMSLVSDSC